ncbi:MAG TPA: DUF1656 domain-containing protein [Pseudomonadales bacterium]|nr:DUF1656 domain-containing protein [Pseudomonadales bacterium]
MIKEINFFGVYLAPFAGYLAVALLIFIPIRIWFDRIEIQKWVWHRWLFEIAIFTAITSVIGLIF